MAIVNPGLLAALAKQNAMTNPRGSTPFNQYDVAQNQNDRQRTLLNALTQQALTPDQGKMIGQVYVGPGLLDALSKPLTALAAQYGTGQLDQQDAQNSQDRQQGLQDALTGLQGKTGSDFSNAAMSSQFPELQQIGEKSLLASMAPKKPETFSLQTVAGADGKPTLRSVGNYGTINSPSDPSINPYEKPVFVGGEAVDPTNVNYGQLYGRDPAPKVQVTVQNTQEGARAKTLGQDEAKQIIGARQQQQAAQTNFNMADRLQQLDQDGVISGPASKPLVFAGQLASGLGINLSPDVQKTLANTENYDQTIGNVLSGMILNSSAGRGFTDTDRDYVKATFPSLMQTPAGRQQAIQFMKEGAVRAVDQGRDTETRINNGTFSQQDMTNGKMDQFRGTMNPSVPQTAQPQQSTQQLPKPGDAMGGYIFQGGDPSSPNSWKPQ